MTDQLNVMVDGEVTVSSPTPAPTPPQKPEKPGVLTIAAMVFLIALGTSLIGAGLGLWIADGDQGPSTTSTAVTSSASTIPSGGGTTTPSGGGTTTGPGGTATNSPQKQAGGSEQTVTTDPADPGTRSDTLTVALLGLGAVLLLAGILFRRISEIGFPGGGVVKFTPLTPGGLGVALGEAVKADPGAAEDPAKMRSLAIEFLDPLTPEGTSPVEAFGEDFIRDTVEVARRQQ